VSVDPIDGRRVAHTHTERPLLQHVAARGCVSVERPSVLVSPVPAAQQARDLDSRVMGVTTVHGLCTV